MQRKKTSDEKAASSAEGAGGPGKRQSSRTIVVSKAMRVVSSEARQEVRDKRLQQLEADNYQEEQAGGTEEEAYEESDEEIGISQKKKKVKIAKRLSKAGAPRATRKIRSLERLILDQNYNAGTTKHSESHCGLNNIIELNSNNASSNSSSSSSSSSNGRNCEAYYQKSFRDENDEMDLDQIEIKDFKTHSSIYIPPSSNSNVQLTFNTNNRQNFNSINYMSIAALPSNQPPRKFCSVCGYVGTYACTRCGCRYCSSKCLASHKETRCLKFSY